MKRDWAMCQRPYFYGSNLEHSLFFQCRYQEEHQFYLLVGTTRAIQNFRLICMWYMALIVEDNLVMYSIPTIRMSYIHVYSYLYLFLLEKVSGVMTCFLQHFLPFNFLVLELPILPVKAFRCGILCSAEDTHVFSMGHCLLYIMPIYTLCCCRDCHRAYSDTRSVLWTKHSSLHISFLNRCIPKGAVTCLCFIYTWISCLTYSQY